MNKTTAHHLNQHARKRRECVGGVFALLALTTLSACGWRVRGKIDLPYRNLLLSGVMTPELRDVLDIYLRANEINLVKTAKEAELILEIVTEQNARQILSYNGAGQITAYRIISRIAFRAFDPNGIDVIPESDIYLTRDIDFNQANIQSFDFLVNDYVREMRVDIVNQLMRRLSFIKKLPSAKKVNSLQSPVENEH